MATAVGGGVDAPWHAAVATQFQVARSAGRLGHAFLITGRSGVGVSEAAGALARWWLCARGTVPACGSCGACRQAAAGAHPGLLLLAPPEDKRAIPVEAVRELCERMALTSHDGAGKVALVDPADALGEHGVNALLKSVEEPAAGNLFLFVSERPAALLATLRSRCQRVRVPLPSGDAALEWLARSCAAASASERVRALALADGAPFRARALLADDRLGDYARWEGLWSQVQSGRLSPVAAASSVRRPGEAGGVPRSVGVEFVHWLARQLQDGIREQLLEGTVPARRKARRAARVVQEMLVVVEDLERHNANVLLCLESVLLRASDFISVAETVA